MRTNREKGLTLIELLLAITIFGLIAAGATALLFRTIDSQTNGDNRYRLYREGLMIMENLTTGLRECTFLFVPNAHQPIRNILAFSGFLNEDNDYYFNDPLFPRIDEDPKKQMTHDDKAGIKGIDDDGDGQVDNGDKNDDDEDNVVDEDPLDGIDNDGDGNIDEDTGDDSNISGMDDDGDGSIDEGDSKDDDEDGTVNEDQATAVVYSFDSKTGTLKQSTPYNGREEILSTRVSSFQATFEAPDRILVEFILTGDNGKNAAFSESVYIENIYQRIGKRVR